MGTQLDRAHLRSRYLFTGKLIMDTALHIGGGRDSSTVTDSPIIRDGQGRPLIPGSSFKGAFRAAVERILPNLPKYHTCQLIEGYERCLSTHRQKNNSKSELPTTEDYGVVSEAVAQSRALGVGNSDSAKDERAILKRFQHDAWVGMELNEDHLLELLNAHLCATCKTFGSVHLASVAHFHDLMVSEPWAETTQIRDGVGIDRDSERAIDQIKFDFEVAPAQTAFDFRLTVENPSPDDLALVALGLHEFINGMVPLGGIRSRGLGRCHLVDVQYVLVDFTKPDSLRDYLLKGWPPSQPLGNFIAAQTAVLVAA